jgi:hypothetical protein
MKRRRIFLLPLGLIALALAVTATAYACTPGGVVGSTTITSPAGSPPQVEPGDNIAATGSGARPNTAYFLHFLNFASDSDHMMTCHGGGAPDQRIGGPRTSNSSGAIASTLGTIPATAQSSTDALVCFIDEDTVYATGPALLVVL